MTDAPHSAASPREVAPASRLRLKPRSLFAKFFLAFILVDALGTLLFTLHSYRQARDASSQSIDYRLMSAALALPEILGEDYLAQLQDPAKADPERYQRTLITLDRYARKAGLASLYAFVKEGSDFRFIMDSANEEEIRVGYFGDYRQLYDQAPPELGAVFADHQPRFAEYQDNFGSFRSLFLAIPGQDGQAVVIGADMFMEGIAAAEQSALLDSLLIGAIIFAMGALVSRILAGALNRYLARLGQATERIADGDYQLGLKEGRDPVGRLGRAMNQMGAALAARERRISQLAFRDMLTRLPNQVRLVLEIRQRIERAAAGRFAVLLLDVANFRNINELLGQEGGDKILRHLARRLRVAAPEENGVARIGADTFVLLLPWFDDASAEAALLSLRNLVEKPFVSGNQRVSLRITFGIACYPEHGGSAEALLANAETALQDARRRQLPFAFHDPDQERQRQLGIAMLDALDLAVDHDQLRLYLQPKIALPDGRVEGAEVLIRWQHPELGLLKPDAFVGIAEQSRKICDITLWVLERCMRLQRERQLGALKLNVNLSLLDLEHPAFIARIGRLLDETGAMAAGFCLEITESRAMSNPVQVLDCLRQLKAMGFELSLDDFGAGHSSLACLSSFPIDELKIDRQFIEHCQLPGDQEVIRLLVQLGQLRGLRVVAEGVETRQALEVLTDLGCDQIQGQLVAGALSLDDFQRWYAEQEQGLWALRA
ncbi:MULTISPECIES: bifunctional diguanylate cyclase/phosphodiesterase [Pseudomonas]|uniref:GGDEF domain-containing protein n=1 Tax=Pseudomonas oryzihabitans TaxID=47885 RepID=A0ABX3IRA1_9PSED|nr:MULTISPECIES: bifunctional diguanylate cyclase/phosphodiesterase [Pseudomonas]KIZ49704.1 diguanylate cyclase [Pseudomonas oryzihabitans]NMZ45973.1 EAL domain-containing protein [Pseudomonas oryzihabitans]ONN70884.1 GGDEF domain-containing protein [Pseudomonas psychrotolerans]